MVSHCGGGRDFETKKGKTMTKKEALEKARDRWGANGYAQFYDIYPGDYAVGIRKMEHVVHTYGRGKSFEAAFEDATKNGY